MFVPQKIAFLLMGLILVNTQRTESSDLKMNVLQIAEKTSEESEHITPQIRRLDLLLDIAKLQIILGASENAQRTLSLVQSLKHEDAGLPDTYNSRIVELWAQSGDFLGAHELAGQILNLRGKLVVLSKIGASQAQAGRLQQARATAAQMETDFQEAHDALAINPYEYWLMDLYNHITRAQLHRGDIEAARDTVGRVRRLAGDPPRSDTKSMGLAIATASIGDIAGTQDAVAAIRSPSNRDRAWKGGVEALTNSGRLREAQLFVQNIQAAEERVGPLITISKRLAERDDTPGAMEILRLARVAASNSQMSHHEGKLILAFGSIIDAQSSLGDFVGASETAKWFDELNRPQYLIRIANAQVKSNDLAGARSSLQEASDLLRRMGPYPVTAGFLVNLAFAQVKAGTTADARQTLDRLRSMPVASGDNYVGIRAAMGDFRGALEDASRLGGTSRNLALRAIVEVEIDSRQFGPATDAANAMSGPERSSELDRIALLQSDTQARSGELKAAVETAGSIKDARIRIIPTLTKSDRRPPNRGGRWT